MLIDLRLLVHDRRVYPRLTISPKTVETYKQALELGAMFPPIEVQAVSNYDPENPEQVVFVVLDGVHRLKAFLESEDQEVEVVEWQPGVVLDYQAHWQELKLEAAKRNKEHGDRLGEADKKMVARDVAESDPDIVYTEERIAESLGVSQQRVNEWITDIRARQRASRESVILRLSRLGWTQEEIAEAVGLSQQRIQQITNNTEIGNFGNLLAQGRDMAYIAQHYNMDLALAWALRLDGKEDHERFQELNWGLRTWDVWGFNDCDERFGDDWPGRIPAQLVAHTLYFFTQPGDLVFDPMAGGGVVPDTCLAFGRRCRTFDMVTRDKRPEIQKHEWRLDAMTWPELTGYKKLPHLIFFDPPYFTKKQADYRGQAEEGQLPISELSRGDYLRFLEQFFILAQGHIRPGGRLAFLNADWRDFQSMPALQEDASHAITVLDYARLLDETGWQITHIIDCPLSTQRLSGAIVAAMQAGRILGTIRRTLLIARRR